MYVFLGTFTFYEHGALTSGYWIAARRCCDNLSTNTLEVRKITYLVNEEHLNNLLKQVKSEALSSLHLTRQISKRNGIPTYTQTRMNFPKRKALYENARHGIKI